MMSSVSPDDAVFRLEGTALYEAPRIPQRATSRVGSKTLLTSLTKSTKHTHTHWLVHLVLTSVVSRCHPLQELLLLYSIWNVFQLFQTVDRCDA